jgi:hypothetical protein
MAIAWVEVSVYLFFSLLLFSLKGLEQVVKFLDPPFGFLVESMRSAMGLVSLSILFSIFSLFLFLVLKKQKKTTSVFSC